MTSCMSSLGNRNRCRTLLNTSLFPADELRSRLSCHTETQMFLLLSRAHLDGGRLPALHPRTRREMLHKKMPFNLWNKAATGIQNIINVIPVMGFIEPMHNPSLLVHCSVEVEVNLLKLINLHEFSKCF